MKREDRSATVYGGNKVRGLEFLFSDLRPGDTVVTIGGWGSTHCLATARHARALGARAVLAQFPQGSSESGALTARASERAADRCLRARTWTGFPATWLRAWALAGRLGRRRYIPGGGATAAAVLGHALGCLELADQLPHAPDAIVTPLGSGGTAAGLLLGCEWLGWGTRVVAVRVAPALAANGWRVRWLAARAGRLLTIREVPPRPPHGPTRPSLMVIDGMGPGYGYPTAAGEEARAWGRACGLIVDSTYGGKALAVLPALARMGMERTVFWHTYADPGGA